MSYRIGMDVGGTNVVIGLFGADGKLLRRSKTRTVKTSSHELLRQLADLCKEIIDAEQVPEQLLSAVGIGLPGFIAKETGLVNAANLPFTDIPVAERLRELLGVPVTVENDVKMIVYGESLRGAGQGYSHILGVTLGTGMASAWVTEGRLHGGAGGLAGEIGHVAYSDIPYMCGCGMKGCLETVVSASGIVRQARDGLEAGWVGLLADRFPPAKREELTSRDVWQAYREGDAFAGQVFQKTAYWLSRVLIPSVALLSPDVMIIGGGVAAAGAVFFEPLRKYVSESLHPLYRERLLIVPPSLGDDSGLYGSAEYAAKQLAAQ
ncbi:ROK family protein [Cohnella cholangitidis]|uniref:ROK family protein n=1 Tax=Cohnella cholangitidis TaxID=2598458 RepID=A0A7G5BUD1_9BACL|nr:ROK family protein [Cohnella cholangitidis]QMV40565.1 ROK family protein [Cohnella cholangitidis]